MEDAHAIVLDLDGDHDDSNAFFAVYDGHGGMHALFSTQSTMFNLCPLTGGTVAKYAGRNVHKRLLSEEAYKEKRYEEALKRAFLGTDEDMLAGAYLVNVRPLPLLIDCLSIDPSHSRDPSGCTAVAALVTKDKIYVVRPPRAIRLPFLSYESPPLG